MAAVRTDAKKRREKYAERKAAGLCIQCGQPAGGMVRCAKHRQKNANRKIRAFRKAHGLCTECGDPAEKGRTKCRFCADLHNYNEASRKQGLRDAGLCPRCGEHKPRKGRNYCSLCLRKYARVNRRRRAEQAGAAITEQQRQERKQEFRRLIFRKPELVAERLAILLRRRPEPDTAAD